MFMSKYICITPHINRLRKSFRIGDVILSDEYDLLSHGDRDFFRLENLLVQVVPTYRCKFCDNVLQSFPDLRRHLREHREKCSTCP